MLIFFVFSIFTAWQTKAAADAIKFTVDVATANAKEAAKAPQVLLSQIGTYDWGSVCTYTILCGLDLGYIDADRSEKLPIFSSFEI